MGEQNGRAKRKRDGTEFEAHRWIDFPSCRLVTESTVYSGKLQLFHYLPNDATVYERAVQPDVCTHRERERETEKTLEGRGSNRCWIFLRQRFDETIGGNDFPRFQRKMIANTLNSLSLSKEAHSYLEKLASTLKEKTLLSLLPFFFPFVKKSSSVAF